MTQQEQAYVSAVLEKFASFVKFAAPPVDSKLIAEVAKSVRAAIANNPFKPLKRQLGPTITETYPQWLQRSRKLQLN